MSYHELWRKEKAMETKPAILSKGVWGSVSAIAGAAILFAQQLGWLPAGIEKDVAELVHLAAAFFGGVLALWGRLSAKKPISGVVKSS